MSKKCDYCGDSIFALHTEGDGQYCGPGCATRHRLGPVERGPQFEQITEVTEGFSKLHPPVITVRSDGQIVSIRLDRIEGFEMGVPTARNFAMKLNEVLGIAAFPAGSYEPDFSSVTEADARIAEIEESRLSSSTLPIKRLL